ncbi:ABC transporter permease [Leucobacter chromiiresistens]|uniref:Spermidine/putrescine transport system permease protein n=1 Tax=Leucobacter chromiiresistens TaxID=1079994 RepID=A0A1H1BQF7_9MICO|nr:ABC transporter permease [Leucobacter chromiiresistens]SDQ53970.1 spermidine/putrescine transport system permease protein [Leucobacter chromiiresistens]
MKRFSLGKAFVPVVSTIVLIYLLLPILHVIVFSFNESGRNNILWRGFTLRNWENPCGAPQVCTAFGNSILVGVVATVIATTLGTLIAIALVRYRFRARSTVSLLLFTPMATPEVVLGAGLAAQFLLAGVEKGIGTIILAHTMFCISYVVVAVKARVASLDPAIEEAGRDLYASPMQVFWRITLPMLAPGIIGAALLSFALSFDDFIITNFNSGTATTFPKFIYVSALKGVPAQANVLASIVFVAALLLVIVVQMVNISRRKRLARA